MKRLLFALIVLALVLSACGPSQSFYVVKLKSGSVMTCNKIEWVSDYLYCDGGAGIYYTKVADVQFKAAK